MNTSAGRESRQAWGQSAASWKRAAAQPDLGGSQAAADWMLAAAELSPGDDVLELACGAGRVGLRAAEMVAPDGRVLCTDFAEPMVAAVSERIAELGIENASARVMDALDIDLGSERFDAALCRFGYMLMPDRGLALRNTRGILKPGGKLAFATWGASEQNPWVSTIFDVIMERFDAPPPQPEDPGPFSMSDPDLVAETVTAAGFSVADTEVLSVSQEYDSPEGWWEHMGEVSGPLAGALASVSEADRDAIKQESLARAEPYAGRGAVSFPASVLCILAKT